jgi:hypothetical protein
VVRENLLPLDRQDSLCNSIFLAVQKEMIISLGFLPHSSRNCGRAVCCLVVGCTLTPLRPIPTPRVAAAHTKMDKFPAAASPTAFPPPPVMPPLPPISPPAPSVAPIADIHKEAPPSFWRRVLNHGPLPYPGKFDDLSKESKGTVKSLQFCFCGLNHTYHISRRPFSSQKFLPLGCTRNGCCHALSSILHGLACSGT